MASEDSPPTDAPDSPPSSGEAVEPASAGTGQDTDPLAAFGDRLRPSRRFYANPAGA